MKSDTQLKVQAYLDNELSPNEARKVAGLISSDREAQELYNELKDTREILTHHEPALKLEESREFYWSKIQRQIESSEREPETPAASPWWIRLLAPVVGTAALFALLLAVMNPSQRVLNRSEVDLAGASTSGFVHEVEELAPDVSTITFRSEAEGVTVVWVSSTE
ncbi:MAG TPA: hypothetical protein VK633_08520 [Verrucomicrobiae bacterium]|nr:hypothetical protein [Verrucomicrobiae bacterium]